MNQESPVQQPIEDSRALHDTSYRALGIEIKDGQPKLPIDTIIRTYKTRISEIPTRVQGLGRSAAPIAEGKYSNYTDAYIVLLSDTLGVPPDATPEERKRKFREVARTAHTDVSDGDEENEARIREVTSAYNELDSLTKQEKLDPEERTLDKLLQEIRTAEETHSNDNQSRSHYRRRLGNPLAALRRRRDARNKRIIAEQTERYEADRAGREAQETIKTQYSDYVPPEKTSQDSFVGRVQDTDSIPPTPPHGDSSQHESQPAQPRVSGWKRFTAALGAFGALAGLLGGDAPKTSDHEAPVERPVAATLAGAAAPSSEGGLSGGVSSENPQDQSIVRIATIPSGGSLWQASESAIAGATGEQKTDDVLTSVVTKMTAFEDHQDNPGTINPGEHHVLDDDAIMIIKDALHNALGRHATDTDKAFAADVKKLASMPYDQLQDDDGKKLLADVHNYIAKQR